MADQSNLQASLSTAISADDVNRFKILCKDIRRLPEQAYEQTTSEALRAARTQSRTSILDFIEKENPFHYNANTASSELMDLHDGILDEDWDEEYALAGLERVVKRGGVFRAFPSTPIKQDSPLRFSIRQPNFVKFLLAHDYDPNERYASGGDPLTEIIRYLYHSSHDVKQAADITKLREVSSTVQSTLKALLTNSSHPLTPSSPADAPSRALNFAVTQASPWSEMVMSTLLQGGVDVNAKAQKYELKNQSRRVQPYMTTALQIAVENGAVEQVQFLLDHGADPSVVALSSEKEGGWKLQTPLQRECVHLLRDREGQGGSGKKHHEQVLWKDMSNDQLFEKLLEWKCSR